MYLRRIKVNLISSQESNNQKLTSLLIYRPFLLQAKRESIKLLYLSKQFKIPYHSTQIQDIIIQVQQYLILRKKSKLKKYLSSKSTAKELMEVYRSHKKSQISRQLKSDSRKNFNSLLKIVQDALSLLIYSSKIITSKKSIKLQPKLKYFQCFLQTLEKVYFQPILK